METFFKGLLGLHVIAGFSSIIIFWLPVLFKKGNKNHRLTGKIYVKFMWIVVVSAAILSIKNLALGHINNAVFLGFLSIISANPLWYGISILKQKKGVSSNYSRMHFGFNILIFLSGLALVIYGISIIDQGVSILMLIFGGLGLLVGVQIIKDYRLGLDKLNWFQQHYKGMIISAIAGYTAFFAFGGRSFFSELLTGYWEIAPWVAPTILGIVSMRFLDRYYAKKGILKA